MDFRVDLYERNKNGRDLIVGDIHGMFSLLKQYLIAIDFDETKDVLYCTGDLVDRGPESKDCVEWMKEPWFRSVMGNHDLKIASTIPEVICFLPAAEDISWFYDIRDEERMLAVARALSELPGMIEVSDGEKRVGIAHASCKNGWESIKRDMEMGHMGRNVMIEEILLWERDIAKQGMFVQAIYDGEYTENPCEIEQIFNDYRVTDIAHVFHGHSINVRKCRPYQVANRYYIDTGAFLSHDGYMSPFKDTDITPGFTICDLWNPDDPLITPQMFHK